MTSTTINLVVKAPNQKTDDQVFTVEANWSVLQLKTYLSSAYPSKPVSVESTFAQPVSGVCILFMHSLVKCNALLLMIDLMFV